MSGARVLVIGDTAFDHYLHVDPNSTADEKAGVDLTLRTVGGTGANAATAAANMGVDVTLLTTIGDDTIGSWLADQLAKSLIKNVHARIQPGDSMIVTIIIDGDSRRVLVDPGVARRLHLPAALPLNDYDATYVTFAPECALELLALRPSGPVIVGAEHWMFRDADFSQDVLLADVVVTNEAGWDAWRPVTLSGEVVVTRGSRGASLYRAADGGTADFPAPRVPAIDATGAGDAFAGVLVASLAKGRAIDVAVQLAVVAGALASTQRGPQLFVVSEAELDAKRWLPSKA